LLTSTRTSCKNYLVPPDDSIGAAMGQEFS
jgi:hypothetical protein